MCTIGIRLNDHTHPVFDVLEMVVRKVILRSDWQPVTFRRLTFFKHLYRHS